MKVRVEVTSVESVANDKGAYYVKIKGKSADIPHRPIMALSGPYSRDRAEDLVAALNEMVPAGVPFPDAGIVCDVLGSYVDAPLKPGAPEGLVQMIAKSVTVLRDAEVALYRHDKRFVDLLEKLRDVPNIPAAAMAEIEQYAIFCGYKAISLETAALDDLFHPRPAEDATPIAPVVTREDAAAPMVGVHSTQIEPAPSMDIAGPVSSQSAEVESSITPVVEPAPIEELASVSLESTSDMALSPQVVAEEVPSVAEPVEEEVAAPPVELSPEPELPPAPEPDPVVVAEPVVPVVTAPTAPVTTPRPAFGGGVNRFGARPLGTPAAAAPAVTTAPTVAPTTATPVVPATPVATGKAPVTMGGFKRPTVVTPAPRMGGG